MEKNNNKPYINLKIYGHTLRGLMDNGIELRTILIGLGLKDVVISEGQTGMNHFESPTLSTTIATVTVPRYSTPIIPEVGRKFTLNLSRFISEINPNNEDGNIEKEKEEVIKKEVEQVLNDILENVPDEVNQVRRNVDIPMTKEIPDDVSFYFVPEAVSYHREKSNINNNSFVEILELDNQEDANPHSFPKVNETVQIDVSSIVNQTSNREDEAETKDKSASVASHDGKSGENQVLHLKCGHAQCQKTLKWRRKYGVNILFKHVMVHAPNWQGTCTMCYSKFRTNSQARYHYKKNHEVVPPKTGCRIYSSQEAFRKMAKTCFGDLIDHIGCQIYAKLMSTASYAILG